MALNTQVALRKKMLYQVYVRNFSEEGTLKAVEKDLTRIKELGTDVLYLLPVHPIGQKNRKGTLGSPYSIQDYRAINPELGTMEDFQSLIDQTHQHGMTLMMDIVFNHTSYDSVLLSEHKEWFYQNEKGAYTNRVADWWDITDFDYTQSHDLYDYLIDTLLIYTRMGVDGFRFDVANVLPLDFLKEARAKVLAVNPASIWLSETTHGHFTKMMRDKGFEALSEGEIYQVFDMSYDYDVHPFFEGYLKKENSLDKYIEYLRLQEEIYPSNYIKLRNVENHDFGRLAGLVKTLNPLKAWHALSFVLKGATMIYMGGEFADAKHPDLFNKDVMDVSGPDLTGWIQAAKAVSEDSLVFRGVVHYSKPADKDILMVHYRLNDSQLIGVFNVNEETGSLALDWPDGTYTDLLTHKDVVVKLGHIESPKSAIILKK